MRLLAATKGSPPAMVIRRATGSLVPMCQMRLTVAVDLTAPDERIETHTAGEWRRRQLPEMNRRPAIFIIG